MDKRKNVLMVCVDQWGANRMGVYGNDVVMTPTLDFLAREGICFENAYTECPICIPARRSLMTGLTPRTHGDRVYKEKLPMPETTTMAEAFTKAGYQAYAIGKLHVYPQRNRIGFDDVILTEEGRNEFGVIDDYQIWLGEEGYIADEFLHGMGNNTYYTRPWHLPEYTNPTTWITKEAMRMIKRKDPTKPGFFYVSYPAPHPPILPLQPYLDMYDRDEIDQPIEQDNWSMEESYIMRNSREVAQRYSSKEITATRRAYYATCTHIDHQVRLLIGTLRECDMLNDTIIVFVCDHGDMLFDHHMVGKKLFYESSAKIPLFFSGKPMEKYRNTDRKKLATLADIMPTILDLCDVEIPANVEGIPLFSKKQHDMIYCEITEGIKATRMVHDGRFKLIYYPCGNIRHMFDLQVDPNELNNISGMAEYEGIESKLSGFLIQNLYGGDENWVRDGKLVGLEEPEYTYKIDYGMHNQRGMHWPPPSGYDNYVTAEGNN